MSQHGPSGTPTATPLPITGANTFFVSSQAPPPQDKTKTPTRDAPPEHTTTAVSPGGGIFRLRRKESQDKVEFEKNLEKALERLGTQGRERPRQMMARLTAEIDTIQKRESRGFLRDDQQWRTLNELLQYDKFVMAIARGQLSPKFVALADKAELKRRFETLNELSKTDLVAQAGRALSAPDPNV